MVQKELAAVTVINITAVHHEACGERARKLAVAIRRGRAMLSIATVDPKKTFVKRVLCEFSPRICHEESALRS